MFAFGKGGHFIDVVNIFASNGFTDDRGIGVETGDNANAVLLKSFVSEKGVRDYRRRL